MAIGLCKRMACISVLGRVIDEKDSPKSSLIGETSKRLFYFLNLFIA
jgi:hypothetical protein